ncbi:MAG: hypothetical protein BV457_09570 [Thermoplasmata archaeon M9B1D]|nr:MAG: hypothetical protein BV457_09570 [Thermoplasmata archaeon M9B1D]
MSDYQNDYIVIVKRLGKGPYILEKLTDYIQNQECITCHKLLQSVSFYNHIAGIMLDELPYPQWVYAECWSCGYQNALWKLCAIDLASKIEQEIHGVNGL